MRWESHLIIFPKNQKGQIMNKETNLLAEPPLVKKYMQNIQPGETNLVEGARDVLIKHGLENKIEHFDNDPNIVFAKDMNPNVQRFKLNTWMDTQYRSCANQNTEFERSMIQENAKPKDWLESFDNYHVPAMKKLGLPQSYDE